jgi:photosystem II stability/assembly factor-like uncharacterized protein
MFALSDDLQQIEDLGTDADKMIYTSGHTTHFTFSWTLTSIEAGITSWNDSDINTDDSFLLVAADSGVYVSTDDGDSWDKYTPSSDDYIQCSCAASGGKAIVLGDTGRTTGLIYTTVDYGANWVNKTVEE